MYRLTLKNGMTVTGEKITGDGFKCWLVSKTKAETRYTEIGPDDRIEEIKE